MKHLTLVVCALSVSSSFLLAQTEQPIRRPAPGLFIAHEGGGPEKVTKGAPFSAETYSEFRQVLGDGNVIERKHRGAMYRDGEGRVRTEQALGVGAMAPSGEAENVIVIRDPVAGVHWILNPEAKTAMKAVIPAHTDVPSPGRQAIHIRHTAGGPKVTGVTEEKLGAANVNGVQAEGTRTTMTVPAGSMGNVRPIEVVTERWFSPQLQVVVKSKHADPRTGEQTFELTNIRTGEPSPALFQVPADYKVPEPIDIKVRRRAPVPHEE